MKGFASVIWLLAFILLITYIGVELIGIAQIASIFPASIVATIEGCPQEYIVTDCDICGEQLSLKYESRTPSFEWLNGFTWTCPVENWRQVCPDLNVPCEYGDYCRVHFFYEDGTIDSTTCNWLTRGEVCKKGPGKYAVYRAIWTKSCKTCCNKPSTPECQKPNCFYNGKCYPEGNIGKPWCDGQIAKRLRCINGIVDTWSMDCTEIKYGYCDVNTGLCKVQQMCGNGICDSEFGECETCKQDCSPDECFGLLCGNGVCDEWAGETYENCDDCRQEKCYVEGSSCGFGLPYDCCPGLKCVGFPVAKCIDESKPPGERCQKISQACGLLIGDCCEGLVCDDGVCKKPGDPGITPIKWLQIFGLSFIISLTLLALIFKGIIPLPIPKNPYVFLVLLIMFTLLIGAVFSIPLEFIGAMIFG